MKALPLKTSFRKTCCIMEIGKHYRLYSSYMNKVHVQDCTLIRVGKKGFNFVSMATSKCIFRRNVYQTDSAKKSIKRDQKVFEIVMPDWIGRVEAYDDDHPTKLIDDGDIEDVMQADKEAIAKAKEEERVKRLSQTRNALYRMEI